MQGPVNTVAPTTPEVGQGDHGETVPSRAHPVSPPGPRRSVVDGGLTVALLLVALVGTAWFVHSYAVNALFDDQFADVNIVGHLRAGSLTFGTLWAQHNENRVFFPNLVVLFLAQTVHLDIRTEVALNAILWWTTAVLLVLGHRRRALVAWAWYWPVALMFGSIVALDDTLFGFNLSWFLVLASLAGALYLIDRRPEATWTLVAAVAVAIIGSYSSFQGLLIWPAGLLLLLLRRSPRRRIIIWTGAAVVTAAVFFVDFNRAETGVSNTSRSLGAMVRFFFSSLGNVLGSSFPPGSSTNAPVLVLGVLVFGLAVVGLVRAIRRPVGGGPLGAALITFGLLCTGASTFGRTSFGIADEGRYIVFTATVWIGAYLALLGPDVTAAVAGWTAAIRHQFNGGQLPAPATEMGGGYPTSRSGRRAAVAVFFLIFLLAIQFVVSWGPGDRNAQSWRANQNDAADVAANIDQAPGWLVARELGTYPVGFIRSMVDVARRQRLSLFATSSATDDARAGLFPSLALEVVGPPSGAIVSGTVLLGVLPAVTSGLDRVDFVVSRVRSPPLTTIRGVHGYGWGAIWRTSATGNGLFEIRAVAHYAGGRVLESGPIFLMVRNHGLRSTG
jgi:hypothetical protein